MHYLDNSATTPVCPEALDAFRAAATADFGNPSSLHAMGVGAEKILDDARKTILASIGGDGGSLIFTGSGSEANNLAVIGHVTSKDRYRTMTVLHTAGEHASVAASAAHLASLGATVAEIPTTGGKIDLQALSGMLDERTSLVSMMLVNNETGALYDVAEATKLVRRHSPGACVHCDATQAYLKVPVDVRRLGVDMLTVSSHKVEGPKGVGALYVRGEVLKKRDLSPIVYGGGQEDGLRSGTENLPGIAAFAAAVRALSPTMAEDALRMDSLRTRLIERLKTDAPTIRPVTPERHAPHILNLILPDVKSEVMLHYLSSRDVYVSSGSACSSHGRHSSRPLTAYGLGDREADCSIRVSFSRHTTASDVDACVAALCDGIASLATMR